MLGGGPSDREESWGEVEGHAGKFKETLLPCVYEQPRTQEDLPVDGSFVLTEAKFL
jgi:hypothetical protein